VVDTAVVGAGQMHAKLLDGGFFEGMLLLTPLDGIDEHVIVPSVLA